MKWLGNECRDYLVITPATNSGYKKWREMW